MLLKHYNKSGIVTWSNSKTNSHLLASAPFSNSEQGPFNLDILALDLTQKSKELSVLGSATSSRSFRCLAWDVSGEKNGTHPSGLIFGGMEDGGITLWDPAQIIANRRNPSAPDTCGLLYQEESICDFPIICAEWNALQPNLLGMGTSQVLVMDIEKWISKGQDPNIFKISDNNPHAGSYITAVAWNKEVPHIMASASGNGLIALWNVKENKPIFSFNQNNHGASHKNISIAWNKTIFAQIAVTLDDENKNQLQIWDLRNQKGPIVVIDKNHSKGINCMDWSDNDPELILASSKDNKVICWNYNREQPVNEIQFNEPIVDIRWSKKLPSIYSVATHSKLEIYTMDENNLYSYVPKWYKVPVSTTLGPNNSLLAFDDKENTTLREYTYNLVNPKLTSSIKNLENWIKSSNIQSYLNARKQNAFEQEKQFWNLMELINSGGLESDIYNYLGFDRDEIIKSAEQYTNKKYGSPSKKTNKVVKNNDYINVKGKDASDFFNNMMYSNSLAPDESGGMSESVKYDMVPRNHDWDTGKQKIIKQNLLIGNYTGAIDAALKCGRGAEALVIAYSQGQEIFKSTLKTFFTETTDPFITGTLRYIADKELEDMVKKYPLPQWKECVAFIYSLVRDHRAEHLKTLAQRLLQDANEKDNALICLALAEDFNELLQLFNKSISSMQSGTTRKVELLNLVQKLLVISKITTKQVGRSALLDRFILEASLILLEQGHTILAGQILQLANTNDEKISYMIYTIAQCLPSTRNTLQSPFRPYNIPIVQKKVKKNPQQQIQQNQPVNNNLNRGGDNMQKPKPNVVTRPHQPIFPSAPKQQETGFNPNVSNRTSTGTFNPVEQPSSNQQSTRPPNIAPPPINIKKPINPPPFNPPPPKNNEIPVNMPPRKEEYQTTQQSQETGGFNPNFNSKGYSQQTQSSHINIPATSIPSINVRNKPPPPPPKVKKAESMQEEKVEEYQQHNSSFQQTKQPEYQHPPPPPGKPNRPMPPPPTSNFNKQQQVYNPQQNVPPPQQNYVPQQQTVQNQQYGYQEPQQVPQNKQQSPPLQVQAPVPPPARKVVPPPPKR